MATHAALGIRSARSRTRILALVLDTRQTCRTIRIDDALRATVGRRSHITGQTLTRRPFPNHTALAVRSARRRLARITRHIGLTWRLRWRQWCTPAERIARLRRIAATDRTVIEHLAARVETASSATRVHALLVDARLVGAAFAAHNALGSALRR